MEIKNAITIDNLTADSVSVKTQRVLVEDSGIYPVGSPNRKAYMNSESGRAKLAADVPDPYCTAVLEVWGEDTTVDENIEED